MSTQTVIKKVLIAKANLPSIQCPYKILAKDYNFTINFRAFLRTSPIPKSKFRTYNPVIRASTAVLFTNKIAIDNFFNFLKLNKTKPLEGIKYFCTSQALGNYLQKHVLVKKRKLFQGKKGFQDLHPLIKKNKKEKFLFPCSNVKRKDIPEFFKLHGYKYKEIIIYELFAHDLTSLAEKTYDMIVFFSPLEVKAFSKNFPDYTPGTTKIATFGLKTTKAVEEAGWQSDIFAPGVNAPSMTVALRQYFKALDEE